MVFKKSFCKLDFKEKRKKLSESALIEFNKSIHSDYNFGQTKQEVIDRWK